MAFCSKCGAGIPDGVIVCSVCGAKTVTAEETDASVKRTGKLHCPNCKSYNFSTVTESSVNGAISTGRNIRTTFFSNTHRNYWMCSDCGTKFRNIQNLEEEIEKRKKAPTGWKIAGGISAFFAAVLLVVMVFNPYAVLGSPASFLMVWLAVLAIYGLLHTPKELKRLKAELAYLKQNCFD